MNTQHDSQPESRSLDTKGSSNAFNQAEGGLQQNETRFRTLMEHIAEGIFIASREGRYIDANPCALDMLGHARTELMDQKIEDTVVESERLRVTSELNSA